MSEKGIPCEVYSRIVGYIRPIGAWNAAKRLEFEQRVTFSLPEDINDTETHETGIVVVDD